MMAHTYPPIPGAQPAAQAAHWLVGLDVHGGLLVEPVGRGIGQASGTRKQREDVRLAVDCSHVHARCGAGASWVHSRRGSGQSTAR